MDQGLIPSRYAKALLMTADDRHLADTVYDICRRLADAFIAQPLLRKTLDNPEVTLETKQKVIATAAQAPDPKSADLLSRFVSLLSQNHRLPLLQQSVIAYCTLYRTERKIYRVIITSAAPLEKSETDRMRGLVAKQLPADATAEFEMVVNPDLIGGFTINLDNELLDASVANELKQLRLKLLSH